MFINITYIHAIRYFLIPEICGTFNRLWPIFWALFRYPIQRTTSWFMTQKPVCQQVLFTCRRLIKAFRQNSGICALRQLFDCGDSGIVRYQITQVIFGNACLHYSPKKLFHALANSPLDFNNKKEYTHRRLNLTSAQNFRMAETTINESAVE